MKTTMQELERNFKLIIQELDDNGGEFTDEIEEFLAINREDFGEKAESYKVVINNYQSDNDKINNEIDRLTELKLTNSKKIEMLEDKIKKAIFLYGLKKQTDSGNTSYSIEFKNINLRLVCSPSLSVKVNENFINENYLKYNLKTALTKEQSDEIYSYLNKVYGVVSKIDIVPDKTLIKADLLSKKLSDENVEIVTNYNVKFK